MSNSVCILRKKHRKHVRTGLFIVNAQFNEANEHQSQTEYVRNQVMLL